MEPEVLQDAKRWGRFIQGIEVDPRHSGAEQLLTLFRGELDAELADGSLVVTQFLEFGRNRRRNSRAAQGSESFDLGGTENRDDARDKGHFYVVLVNQTIAKFIKIHVVEKQLGDDEIGSGLNFFSQMLPIDIFAFFTGDVAFREAGNPDGKVAQLTDE
jgi:hypothetical protein